ncbi:MAG: hypothetical protein WEB06_05210 [Actinomycetota bacterium]
MDTMPSKRSLVALVGAESESRTKLARALIRNGTAVVICGGPPGCPLLRGEECAIVESVDGVVVMPHLPDATTSDVAIGLTRCAFETRTAIAIEPSAVHPLSGATHLPAGASDELAGAIRDLITAR